MVVAAVGAPAVAVAVVAEGRAGVDKAVGAARGEQRRDSD